MPALILNDFGDPQARLSDLKAQHLRGDYSKVAALLFDPLIECTLYTPPEHGAIVVMAIPPGPRAAYSGRNIEFLSDKKKVIAFEAGFDDTLQEFIEDRHGLFEQKEGEDCLIHPAFMNRELAIQPALTIRFLDDAVVPSVPLYEVLEFKERHDAELKTFWSTVYKIAEAPTGILKQNPESKIRRELEAALAELESCQKRSFGGRVLQGAEMTIGLSLNAIAALAAYQFGYSTVGDLLSSSGVGLNLERRIGREPSERAKAMTFIHKARRELQNEAPKRDPFNPVELKGPGR